MYTLPGDYVSRVICAPLRWPSAFGGRPPVGLAMVAQRGLLVRANSDVGTGVGAAHEHVARCLVLRVDAKRFGLVHLPFLDSPCASNAPPLETRGRQIETRPGRGEQKIFVRGSLKAGLAFGRDAGYRERLVYLGLPYGL